MDDAISQFLSKKKGLADEYRDIIEGMLNDFDNPYAYAYETLTGILEYIEANGTITQNQVTAVNNIKSRPSYEYGSR